MAHERELRMLLDDAAPVGRVAARSGTVHHHAGDRELAVKAFATRFEIDRGGKAIGLLVERRAGAVAVDERIKRPAGPVERGSLIGDRRRDGLHRLSLGYSSNRRHDRRTHQRRRGIGIAAEILSGRARSHRKHEQTHDRGRSAAAEKFYH